jgi:alpha-galactosidase
VVSTAQSHRAEERAFEWTVPGLHLGCDHGDDRPVRLVRLTAGVIGRTYLSGFLNELGDEQFALVREAIALHKDWRHRIAQSHPVWPFGLPGWEDDVIALQLDAGDESLLALWSRGEAVELELPGLRGRTLEQLYPVALPEWTIRMSEGAPIIEVPSGPAARIFVAR